MKPACRLCGPLAMVAALDDRSPVAPVARHVAGCLRCQAEAARGRALRRGFAALGAVRYPAPRDFAAGIARHPGVTVPRRRVPVVPVVVAAASVVVALSLRRRLAAG